MHDSVNRALLLHFMVKNEKFLNLLHPDTDAALQTHLTQSRPKCLLIICKPPMFVLFFFPTPLFCDYIVYEV